MRSLRKVALLIETSSRYGRDLVYGVRDWTQKAEPWSLQLAASRRGIVPSWMAHWQGDGIIAAVDTPAMGAALARTGLPVVDVSDERHYSEFPRVGIDNAAVSKLAADHLRQKGFSHFGYCGDPRFIWSRQRAESFAGFLGDHGLKCRTFGVANSRSASTEPDVEIKAIARWIGSLPKPVGIFACYDRRAQQVLEACDLAEVRVPDEVAVLGVDDDELICELSEPPLSSILPNARGTGFIAASLLAERMNGARPGRPTPLVEPIGVIERRSTDAVAIPDRKIADALRFIRTHACEGIRVSDVLKATPISRTVFDIRFKRILGCSAHTEILNAKLRQAKYHLAASSLPVTLIAGICGFPNASYFSAAFRRRIGVTPNAYRTRHRAETRFESNARRSRLAKKRR